MVEVLLAGGVLVTIGSLIGMFVSLYAWSEGPFIGSFVCLIVGFVVTCIAALTLDADARAAFMAGCLAERKQYECTAMWRAGDVNVTPVVVPMVVR